MRSIFFAVLLFVAGVTAGFAFRPYPALAGSSFDPDERLARATEKIADQLSELRRAAEKKVEVSCRCDCGR